MRTVLLIWGSIFLSFAQLHAQSVVNATGNSFSGGFYQLDWSVGELALVNEMRSADGKYIITNGFLQSGEAGIANPNHRFSDDEIRIRPNFTNDKVEVSLMTRQQGKVLMQVFDVSGRVVFHKSGVSYGGGNVETIALRSLASGTYFLKVDLVPAPGSVPKTGSYKIVKY